MKNVHRDTLGKEHAVEDTWKNIVCSEKVEKFHVTVEHGDERLRARDEIERAG